MKHPRPDVPPDSEFTAFDINGIVSHVNIKCPVGNDHLVLAIRRTTGPYALQLIACQGSTEITVIIFSKSTGIETVAHGAYSGTCYALRH